jgi:hypothetical protein
VRYNAAVTSPVKLAPKLLDMPPQTRKNLPVILSIGGFLLVVFGILLYLCRTVWFSLGSPLGYQALVPLGALLLMANRRQEVHLVQRELASLFPDAAHPKRRGNEIPVWIGGLLLLAGVFAAFPAFGILGFIFLAFGVVYYLAGPFVVRALALPLSLLFLMLFPPPIQTFYGFAIQAFHVRSTAFAGYILKAFGQKPHIQDSTLILPGRAPLSIPIAFNGLDILLSALAFAVFCIAWQRLKSGMALILFFFAVTTAMMINVSRILLFSAVQAIEILPSAVFQAFMFLMIWQMAKKLALIQPKEREQ